MADLFTAIAAAFIMTLGFGVLLNGQEGASKVTTAWLKGISRSAAWVVRSAGDLLHWVAKKIRR